MMMQMSVSSEFEFLAGMIPHHRKAADDARIAVGRSQRPELQELAQEIIDAQEAEIEQMEAWLAEWYPDRDRGRVTAEMNQAMMSMNMPDLKNLSGNPFDRAFLEGMTMHHRMAIQMVDSLLGQNLVKHSEVRALAEEIKASQKAEIAKMQRWLGMWFGGGSTSTGHSSH